MNAGFLFYLCKRSKELVCVSHMFTGVNVSIIQEVCVSVFFFSLQVFVFKKTRDKRQRHVFFNFFFYFKQKNNKKLFFLPQGKYHRKAKIKGHLLFSDIFLEVIPEATHLLLEELLQRGPEAKKLPLRIPPWIILSVSLLK